MASLADELAGQRVQIVDEQHRRRVLRRLRHRRFEGVLFVSVPRDDRCASNGHEGNVGLGS